MLKNNQNTSEIWEEVVRSLENKIGETSLKTWIKSIEGICFSLDTCILTAPSFFHKHVLDMRYFAMLENAVNSVTRSDFALSIVAKSNDKENAIEAKDNVSEKCIIDRLNPAYTFENFISGSCNKKVIKAALKVINANIKDPDPLIITGGAGTGKTHLLHAIGNDYKENNKTAGILYIGIDDYINEFMRQIRTDNKYDFERNLKQFDLLLIDDLHLLEGKNRTQLELISMLRRLKSKSVKLVLASIMPIEKIMTENYLLLIESVSIVKIYRPDYHTKKKILMGYNEMYEVALSNDAVELIARVKYPGIRELKGAFNKASCLHKLASGGYQIKNPIHQ